jgi:hypothetical protein
MIKTRDEQWQWQAGQSVLTPLAYTPGLMDIGLLFILPLFFSYCILFFNSMNFQR